MKIKLKFTAALTISYVLIILTLVLGWSFLGAHIFYERIKNNTCDSYYKELKTLDANYIQNFYNVCGSISYILL